MRYLVLALLAPSFAVAGERQEWIGWGGAISWVELHEPTEPGAMATLTFENRQVHQDSEGFALTHDGMSVQIELEWQADGTQAERLTITPPEGYIAVPRSLQVDENTIGVAHIYSNGVGM